MWTGTLCRVGTWGMLIESRGRFRVPVSTGCVPAAPGSESPGCGNLGKQEHWYVRAESPREREPGGMDREPGWGGGQAAPGRSAEPCGAGAVETPRGAG